MANWELAGKVEDGKVSFRPQLIKCSEAGREAFAILPRSSLPSLMCHEASSSGVGSHERAGFGNGSLVW